MNFIARITVQLTREWWQKLLFYMIFTAMNYIVIYSTLTGFLGYNFFLNPLILLFVVSLPLVLIEHHSQFSKWFYLGFFLNNIEKKNLYKSIVITLSVFIVYSIILVFWGSEVSFFNYFDAMEVIKIFYILLITAFIEELFFRGAVLNFLIQRFSNIFSISVVSVAFTTVHIMNPNINFISLINVFLMSVVLSMIFLRTHSLIIVTVIHFLWNMYQVLILGWSVSGINYYYSVTQFSKNNLPEIISGGSFGIEGSLATTILLILSGYLFYQMLKINPEVSALLFKRDYEISNS